MHRTQATFAQLLTSSHFPPGCLFFLLACLLCPIQLAADDRRQGKEDRPSSNPPEENEAFAAAILGGGCFWCVETDFEKLKGVVNVVSGYSGGRTKNPTYKSYASGGHREVVFIVYDPTQVTYAGLVEWLVKHVNPTDRGGSFQDRGAQYRPTIYYENEEEKREAERVISTIDGWRIFRSKINIAIEPRRPFWPAEEYHQDYHHKNGLKYRFFRAQSGRDTFVLENWGPRAGILEIPGSVPDQAEGNEQVASREQQAEQPHWMKFEKLSPLELRKRLNPVQYHVTQENGTEPAFNNKYWNHKEEGIYVDILSGAPLFSSADKFDSGTGWPSFTKPIVLQYLVYHQEYSPTLGKRTEVRSGISNIHLGHVFSDGPPLAGGKRYCMNSAALRFVPKEQMEQEGYGELLKYFPR